MRKKLSSNILHTLILLLSSTLLQAQEIPDWKARVKLSDSGYVDFLQYFQVWNTITLESPKTNSTPRLDTYIRRARFGLGGQINSKALFYVGFTYDGIGKDSLTISAGNPNPGDNTTFYLRDAFFTYKFNSYLNLTFGYFRPRAGKESIYSSAYNISQEKGQPSFQPRIHMVGRGIGRETGLNLGGFRRGKKLSLLYDVGVFNTTHPLIQGNNTIWSPLFTARIVLMIGDPEFETYRLSYHQSGYMKRKGLSIGFNATYQIKTSLFRNNLIYGLDAQLNYGPFDLLAEYLWLYRESWNINSYFVTNDNSYVIKAAWNFGLPRSQILQFSAMHTATIPDNLYKTSGFNPFTRASLRSEWAFGFNWLIKRNRLKIGLHFVDGKLRYIDNDGNSKIGPFRYINPSFQWMM